MTTSARTFGGRYVVIDSAGTGGMAEVYRARDELLGRDVAVKVLSARLSTDQTFVERFRREAQAAANLNHPNVVSLYDFGADGTTYYIVMEYIDGQPLADIIKMQGPLMPERAAEITADVAKGLERAHGAGLVHRDIKPSNIMINSAGQTKVTDFGIARALSREGDQTMTQTGMVIGTAAYLSPEQAQGHPVDQRSDVYSLGCVLYEMLGGRAPFAGDTPLSIAYKHVRENPAPPSQVNPDVPSALDAIVMKALAKNPDNRYQSAAEFRQDLERFLRGERVHATPLMAPDTAVATGTRVMSETEEPPYPPESKRGAGFWILMTLLALAAIALLGFLLRDALFGASVEVPDVTGLRVSEARSVLEEEGLGSEVRRRPSDEPVGTVVDQDPAPGSEIDEGGTVTLFASSGPKKVEVPDLTGLDKSEAKATLEDLELELGNVDKAFSDTVEEGDVIDQSPAPEKRVEPGTEVDIVVSEGPEPILVPDVVGLDEEAARGAIEGEGLTVIVEEAPSDDFDEGIVFDQDPDAGAELDAGEPVTISVSTGPEPFPMPDVVGDDADGAQAELEAQELNVSQVEEPCADTSIAPGEVCRTDPEPGEEVEAGDSVTLFVQPAEAASPSPGE